MGSLRSVFCVFQSVRNLCERGTVFSMHSTGRYTASLLSIYWAPAAVHVGHARSICVDFYRCPLPHGSGGSPAFIADFFGRYTVCLGISVNTFGFTCDRHPLYRESASLFSLYLSDELARIKHQSDPMQKRFCP